MRITVNAIRKTQCFTIEEMAEKLGVSPDLYRFYEENPKLIPTDIALKISAVGHISVDYIFFG